MGSSWRDLITGGTESDLYFKRITLTAVWREGSGLGAGSREASKDTATIIQARDDVGLDQGHSNGGGEK